MGSKIIIIGLSVGDISRLRVEALAKVLDDIGTVVSLDDRQEIQGPQDKPLTLLLENINNYSPPVPTVFELKRRKDAVDKTAFPYLEPRQKNWLPDSRFGYNKRKR